MTMIEPRIHQALVVAKALKLYDSTGMKVNRSYTPTAMLRTASNITGRTFKRGQYLQAHDALYEWVDEQIEKEYGPDPMGDWHGRNE